jgi:hypothetical protein
MFFCLKKDMLSRKYRKEARETGGGKALQNTQK